MVPVGSPLLVSYMTSIVSNSVSVTAFEIYLHEIVITVTFHYYRGLHCVQSKLRPLKPTLAHTTAVSLVSAVLAELATRRQLDTTLP